MAETALRKAGRSTSGMNSGQSYSGYTPGNSLGIVPRGAGFSDPVSLHMIETATRSGAWGLAQAAEELPLHLLAVLADIHPLGAMALENDIALAGGEGNTRIVAVKDHKAGKGTIDDDATALLTAWLQREGGVSHWQSLFIAQRATVGLAGVEFWRDQDGEYHAADFDPLSVVYTGEEGRDGRPIAKQRRFSALSPLNSTADLVTLPADTVWLNARRRTRANPYGKARYMAFVAEAIADIAQNRSVNDGLRGAFFSRLAITIPWQSWCEYARTNPKILQRGDKKLTPEQYADEQAERFQEMVASMLADDYMFLGEGADAKPLNVTLDGVSDLLDRRRLRVCQSLHQYPTLLGIDTGTSLSSSSGVQLVTACEKLEFERAAANAGVLFLANWFLRAMGLDMIARAENEPIAIRDLKALAEARAAEIANEESLVRAGYRTGEDSAVILTGTGVADPERHAKWLESLSRTPAPGATMPPTPSPTPGA
jgi:hypothetical protein